jgi:putative endonuclease
LSRTVVGGGRQRTPAQERGDAAEHAVAAHLAARGFEVIALNLRLGALELDVVARSAELVVVVEVRSRGCGAWTSGFGSVGGTKRAHIRRAGERLWRRRFARDRSVSRLRFDAASVTFSERGPVVDYVAAAF